MKIRQINSITLIHLLQIFFFTFICFSCNDNIRLNAPNKLIVILKADDLGDTTANWNRYIKVIADQGICSGIGIIAKNVHHKSFSAIREYANLKQEDGSPVIEFWNHGYDHFESKTDEKREFYDTSFRFQFEHMERAQHFFSDSLHINCSDFGAPFNRTTCITSSVLEHFPDIKIWQQFGKTEQYFHTDWKDPKFTYISSADKHIILSLDYLSLYELEAQDVKKNFNKDLMKPYIVIQIHPAIWNDKIFQSFDSIINFYKASNKVVFMTPNQYYVFLRSNQH